VTEAAQEEGSGIDRLLLGSGAVRFGRFTLASGETSDVYVDIKRVWTRPEALRALAKQLAARVGEADKIAGLELGAVPLVVALGLETGRPIVVVRKAAKGHGTQRRYEGDIAPGDRILVIEDVVTTGGSVADTIEVLRAADARVDRVLAVVDRESGGTERLASLGARLEALTTLARLRGAAA
jgi:orotate phosphoribosyltransferase